MQAKRKSETVSVRLPKPLIITIKQQAKKVSVPWTSYIHEVLETGVSRIARGIV
jgi:predicted DNA binding CopG/RHH family protein